MDEAWTRIMYDGFEGYDVSDLGQIMNNRRNHTLKLHQNSYGVVWVGLVDRRDMKQKTRGVAHIVADHFVEGRSAEYNTPININGDRIDCRASNLTWRPRWFAVKFFQQFREPVVWTSEIMDEGSRKIYPDSRAVAQEFGVLEVDVMKCVVNGEHIFPTRHTFSRV